MMNKAELYKGLCLDFHVSINLCFTVPLPWWVGLPLPTVAPRKARHSCFLFWFQHLPLSSIQHPPKLPTPGARHRASFSGHKPMLISLSLLSQPRVRKAASSITLYSSHQLFLGWMPVLGLSSFRLLKLKCLGFCYFKTLASETRSFLWHSDYTPSRHMEIQVLVKAVMRNANSLVLRVKICILG